MWYRGEVERLRAERDRLLRASEDATAAGLAHERVQIAHQNELTTHEEVVRVYQNTKRTLRDIIYEGNERDVVQATLLVSAQNAHLDLQAAITEHSLSTSTQNVSLRRGSTNLSTDHHAVRSTVLTAEIKKSAQEKRRSRPNGLKLFSPS